jgi:hypothetical protein
VERTSRASAASAPSASPHDARAMLAIALRSVGQRSLGSLASIRMTVAPSGVGHSRAMPSTSASCARS